MAQNSFENIRFIADVALSARFLQLFYKSSLKDAQANRSKNTATPVIRIFQVFSGAAMLAGC